MTLRSLLHIANTFFERSLFRRHPTTATSSSYSHKPLRRPPSEPDHLLLPLKAMLQSLGTGGASRFPITNIRIHPTIAIVSDASNIFQDDTGNYSGLCIGLDFGSPGVFHGSRLSPRIVVHALVKIFDRPQPELLLGGRTVRATSQARP